METTPAVQQAECDNCDDDSEFSVLNREYEMTPDEDQEAHITRTVRCGNCRSEGTIRVDYDGTTATGCVSFENASWNQTDDEEDN